MSNTPTRRFVIVGAGAVGGSIAAELQLAGIDVLAVARGAEYAKLAVDGLEYLKPGSAQVVRFAVADGPEGVRFRESDVILLTTKSQDTEAIVQRLAWQPATRADGTVGTVARTVPIVTLQNGVSNERTAARWFSTVYGGVLAFPVNKESVGQSIAYSTTLLGLIWLGRFVGGDDEELADIASALESARLGIAVVDDIRDYKVTKLVYNTVNAIEPVFAASDLRDQLRDELSEEGWRVFEALGRRKVSLWDAETGLNHDLLVIGEVEGHPRSGNSTWQSFTRGAPVESDYLNGDIVLEGRLAGIPTPLNEAIQEAIRDVIAGRRPVRVGDNELAAFLAANRAPVAVA